MGFKSFCKEPEEAEAPVVVVGLHNMNLLVVVEEGEPF